MEIPTGFNMQIERIMMGLEFQFLNPHAQGIVFLQLALHDCEGCMTLNFTLFGVHLYIGWMKNSGMNLLRDRLREIQEREV